VQLNERASLSVRTLAANDGPLQLKFNIFPKGDLTPFDLNLEDVRAYQEIR
jgi:hypothetical protein